MSVPTALAAGFFFLGGILLQLVNMLRYSNWRAIISPLLMLIGAFSLIFHLAQVWLSWYQTPSPPTFDQPAKEDSHETQN